MKLSLVFTKKIQSQDLVPVSGFREMQAMAAWENVAVVHAHNEQYVNMLEKIM